MMENINNQKVICAGGLNSNINHLYLSDNEPGSAVELLNFESSLYGGYRRLSGFSAYNEDEPEVDPVGAEGRIYVVAIYGNNVITARKQQSGNTYDFYVSTGSGWSKLTTGLTRVSTDVKRIRWVTFNFDGTEKIIFVDGVNPACVYDGTNWTEILSTNGGTTYADAGGNQALDAPSYVDIFKNHIFMSDGHIVFHSAPLSEYNWTAAAGAGQLPAGYTVNQIKPFRDALFVFGTNNIKKISISGTDFVLNDVTSNIGCLAPDSVIEVGGNLLFLSQDGFRPISGTDRIGDIELDTVSRKIQQLVKDEIVENDMSEVVSVLIRGKSQVRFFFSGEGTSVNSSCGIIGCLKGNDGGIFWEWSKLQGIRASCATSKYIGATEYVLHGDYNGYVYRQEVGNTFAGDPILAVYTTPFLDFSDATVRKTMRKIRLFIRPEGDMTLSTRLIYDWKDIDKLNPEAYSIGFSNIGTISIYGEDLYGTDSYSSLSIPVLVSNVEGSGLSVQMIYSTYDTKAPYTIQGALYEFDFDGRK